MSGLFANMKAKKAAKDLAKRESRAKEIEEAEERQWPDEVTRGIARRYQVVLGIEAVVDQMRHQEQKTYLRLLTQGYFNPIPTAWAGSRNSPLTWQQPFSAYDDAAEERMYWVLNNHRHPGQENRTYMKPDEWSEMRMAQQRMNRAQKIDMQFASPHDTFQKQYGKRGYTAQVPAAPLHKEFIELARSHQGGVGIDMMILMDTSGSMGFNHAMSGFMQPRHIDVVHSILSRAMHFTGPRDHYTPPGEEGGIETVCFNSSARHVGRLNLHNFYNKWNQIERSVGGGTQVMQGWQMIKNMHYAKHGAAAGAWFHPTYGWQSGPDMVKLSLCVLLDGEANDMDEFELEIMGESWAYVTILLIGRDGCPNHHRHANELERVAQTNPHIQFFDCQGRIAERLLLYQVLQALYPAQPPSVSEIMNPAFDHPPPAYSEK